MRNDKHKNDNGDEDGSERAPGTKTLKTVNSNNNNKMATVTKTMGMGMRTKKRNQTQNPVTETKK